MELRNFNTVFGGLHGLAAVRANAPCFRLAAMSQQWLQATITPVRWHRKAAARAIGNMADAVRVQAAQASAHGIVCCPKGACHMSVLSHCNCCSIELCTQTHPVMIHFLRGGSFFIQTSLHWSPVTWYQV